MPERMTPDALCEMSRETLLAARALNNTLLYHYTSDASSNRDELLPAVSSNARSGVGNGAIAGDTSRAAYRIGMPNPTVSRALCSLMFTSALESSQGVKSR